MVVRDTRPSDVRDASGLRRALGSRHRAARGSGQDDVYDWLELVFRFCEGKPFVYYSQYTPSARIYALARSHKVRMRWCPLGHLSGALVARHRYWRQLWLADSQWRALKARLARRWDEQGPPLPVVAV